MSLREQIAGALHKADQELDLMPIEERERHDWGSYLADAVLRVIPNGTAQATSAGDE